MTFNEGGSLVDEGTVVGHGTLVYSSLADRCTSSAPPTPTPAPTTTWPWSRSTPPTSRKVNPSVPFWGGPTGIDTDGTAAGDRVWTYGNSSLRVGVSQLSPHTGISLGDDAADGGWSHPLYTVTPGHPR